ncbi:biotin--[acetyl-CoA-carboxylase] ligase [Methanococcoides orientis]|uniref:biotin--[acetyl-CoA-carboxylase] ligase n=1 Tax=Methanococcoides orientis TaxID=2822137 RepID=UPI001E57CF1F|nr:biotin--[acetyl-CoA-carboxylase] ligase [Methanococcoides orientis]UGV40922.1 biotin--[acetyl-CoA-carboxylase] ligase [Methanococcoides orientis]
MVDRKMDILIALKEAGKEPISGEEIGEKLGISRTMVWKYIKILEEDGYVIGSSPGSGYVLISAPDKLYPSEISIGLDTDIIGKEIHYFESVDSTNDMAKKMGFKAEEGTVVIAEMQESGRGRKGDRWVSPKGGIWLSVILKPGILPVHAPRLTLMAGVAVARAIRQFGVAASIKWPNDVVIDGKKVCGILTEMDAEVDHIGFVVIGIGINANVSVDELPGELRDSCTSLSYINGENINRAAFVQDLLRSLEAEYLRFKLEGFSKILEDWISLSDTIGRQVEVITPQKIIAGKATGVTAEGALIVETSEGVQEIMAGRCIYK